MNRRNFLLLGSAAGGVAVMGGGAVFVKADKFHGWVTDVLRRALPGFEINQQGLALFLKEQFERESTREKAFAAVHGLVDVKWAVDGRRRKQLEEEERSILTNFLLGSDFFQNYPPGPTEVTYLGKQQGCSSPFAQF